MTKRINDMLANSMNVSLPSYAAKPDGGCSMNNEDWMLLTAVRTLRELEKLNRLLACPNFIGIPATLRTIAKQTKKRKYVRKVKV